MLRILVYLLYNLLLPVLLIIGLPSFIVKGIRRGGLARNFRQRFGFFSPATLARFLDRNPIWIHAVSVGEVFLALKIIEAIRSDHPAQSIVLSTTTTTGYGVAVERESETLTVIHNPIDLPFVNARVIRLLAPSKMVLVEAEIWPNLVAQLKRRGIPVLLANARLSPRSEKRYRMVAPFIRPIFSLLDGATVPFEIDRSRWAALGIPEERILVTGSVKFDSAGHSSLSAEQRTELKAWLVAKGMPESSRILLAGSTHDGEERLLAEVAEQVKKDIPDLVLVIVPRHAERGAEIAAQLGAMNFETILRVAPKRIDSATRQGFVPAGESLPRHDHPRARIWIANTTGELRAWFHLSEVVVIGKSFRSTGGQNPVEPILVGRPVVVGPHMENFTDVVNDLVRAGGILQLESEKELAPALLNLLQDPPAGLEMAKRGAAAMARHEGAAARTASFLLS